MEKEEVGPLVARGPVNEYVVSGLGSVRRIDAGWAEFGFFRSVQEFGAPVRLLKVTLIAPIAAVGPGFDLCVAELGSGVIVPLAGRALPLLM